MSRLAKKPVIIPEGVTVHKEDGVFRVVGTKGEQNVPILPHVEVVVSGNEIRVTESGNSPQGKMNSGTMWSLLKNAIEGVSNGFKKVLELEGVGYRAALEGDTLVLSLGYVNPVRVSVPSGIHLSVEKNTITVSGIHKELVGRVAAEIRSLKKPEPYKGKGIRYRGEVIRRKAGKKATAVQG